MMKLPFPASLVAIVPAQAGAADISQGAASVITVDGSDPACLKIERRWSDPLFVTRLRSACKTPAAPWRDHWTGQTTAFADGRATIALPPRDASLSRRTFP